MSRSKKHNQMYVTRTEHEKHFGGKKTGFNHIQKRRQSSFDCCKLTFQPCRDPVMCVNDGSIFELENIEKFIEKEGNINPITGNVLNKKGLIKLNIFKNENGKYHCPVTRKVFNDYTKICAIKTTGNVFSYSAVEEMNLNLNKFYDLKDGTKFEKDDVVVIQDPNNLFSIERDEYWYYKKNKGIVPNEQILGKERGETENQEQYLERVGIVPNKTTQRIFKKIQNQKEEKKKKENVLTLKKREKKVVKKQKRNILYKSTPRNEGGNTMSSSFTSTYMTKKLRDEKKKITIEDLRENMYDRVKKKKKKSFITLHTTMGDMKFEIFFKKCPMTSHNFLMLCEKGYYDGTIFHRLVKGFVLQGGKKLFFIK